MFSYVLTSKLPCGIQSKIFGREKVPPSFDRKKDIWWIVLSLNSPDRTLGDYWTELVNRTYKLNIIPKNVSNIWTSLKFSKKNLNEQLDFTIIQSKLFYRTFPIHCEKNKLKNFIKENSIEQWYILLIGWVQRVYEQVPSFSNVGQKT